MYFGNELLKENEDLFYYRTGIALKLWEQGVGKTVV
jgi:hypothetical protein